MAKLINAQHGVVMQNEDSIFNYFAWPSVALLPDGRLAVSASGFRLAHVCPFGKAVLSYSFDGGLSWTSAAPVIDTMLDDRDSGITVFDKGVIVTSFNNTAQKQYEWAEGERYADTRALRVAYIDHITPEHEQKYLGSTYKISRDGGYTFGEIMRAPASAPHGPIALKSGGLFYLGNTVETRGSHHNVRAYFSPDGINWETRGAVTEHAGNEEQNLYYCEPHACELPDGSILAHIRIQGEKEGARVFTIYQSISKDGGHSWSEAKSLGTDGSPPHLMLHSSGVLVCVYGRRNAPYGQRIMISRDLGDTWDDGYALREDGTDGDLGYPASCELPDGRIITVYYQKKAGCKNTVIMSSIWDLKDIV